MNGNERRPSRQFSLRALLVFVTCVAAILGWIAFGLRNSARDLAIIGDIPQGHLTTFSRRAFTGTVWRIQLYCFIEPDYGDKDLEEFAASIVRLEHLELLVVHGQTSKVTDRGILALSRLSNLDRLVLRGRQFTPDGVARLQEALPDCQIHAHP